MSLSPKRMTVVVVTARFVGFHKWVDAPDQYDYLRNFHRHEFHVDVQYAVEDLNREVEFCDLKARLHEHLQKTYQDKQFELSCEQLAHALMDHFGPRTKLVKVSEDGENGAVVVSNLVPKSWTEEEKPKWETTPVEIPISVRDFLPKTVSVVTDVTINEETGNLEVTKERAPWDHFKEPPAANPCFFGVEAEGPNQGTATLFVPGSATPAQVREATVILRDNKLYVPTSSHPNKYQIYYGAGNDRNLREDTAEYVLSIAPTDMLTVEVNGVDDTFGRGGPAVRKMVQDAALLVTTEQTPPHWSRTVYVKTVTGTAITWKSVTLGAFDPGLVYTTRTDDFRFKLDRPILSMRK